MLERDLLSKVEEGEIEKINKEEELKRLEKEEDNKFPCCFEGFMKHKCLLCWCISSIIISLAIATVISIALMAIILMSFGNKEEEICYPIQKKTSSRLLRNQEETNITGSEKTLQIISQNETHTSIVMPCDSSVINEQGDTFSIEGCYVLNCNESRTFNYIDKVMLWTDGTCAATKKYPDFPGHLPVQNYSTTITDYFDYCGWWKYWCRTVVACIPSDYITLQRCFWEEKTSGLVIKKNGVVIEHYSVTLSVPPHLVAPYGFWKHTNNATGKRECIFKHCK
jgi:hypothetical protein